MNNLAAGAAPHRKRVLLGLVRERRVRSQEELLRLLSARGFTVTQSTLSRDLRDLSIAKTSAGYVVPQEVAVPPERAGERLDRVLREFVVSVAPAGTLIVIRTLHGGAHPVALAIDDTELTGVVGTIAGEDTVFAAAATPVTARGLAARLLAPVKPVGRSRRPRAA